MFNISYFAPAKLSEALEYLYEHKEAKVLAGGTDLIAKWKKIGHPDMELLDIRNIENFAEISEGKDGLFIGAGAKMAAVQYNSAVNEKFPILAWAASVVGSVQVRNLATIGGNICNAAPSADTVTPLIVYGAEAVIVSKKGERRCLVKDFFTGPGKTVLQSGELLKGFVLPYPEKGSKAAFSKHGRRIGMDLATVGVAVNACVDGGKIKDVKVALGAVGPTPIYVTGLEKFAGAMANEAAAEEIAALAEKQAKPITDVRGTEEYRKDMVYENVRKCLKKAFA
ncbi:MAG: FAD binding domain-containing protein [Synergistes sp.]|nr:FAD binding domain-containing protein [Synergistes sp.]